MNGLTKEAIDAFLNAPKQPWPGYILIGQENYAVMRIVMRGNDEGWDWRRVKREAKKGTRSKYRGGWNAAPPRLSDEVQTHQTR